MVVGFGWSVGDVIACINLVYTIWNSVSDGPLNARLEATQFFQEFSYIIGCLEDWDRRKEVSERNSRLAASHQELREHCTTFIKRHMRLIQKANPNTKAIREGRSTWLRNVPFSREQVISLYEHVEWPLERKEVVRLRKKLQLFLQLAIYDVTASTQSIAAETNEMVRVMQ